MQSLIGRASKIPRQNIFHTASTSLSIYFNHSFPLSSPKINLLRINEYFNIQVTKINSRKVVPLVRSHLHRESLKYILAIASTVAH